MEEKSMTYYWNMDSPDSCLTITCEWCNKHTTKGTCIYENNKALYLCEDCFQDWEGSSDLEAEDNE